MDINWYAVGSAAFMDFPVTTLRVMALGGNDTPASGDALALAKDALGKGAR